MIVASGDRPALVSDGCVVTTDDLRFDLYQLRGLVQQGGVGVVCTTDARLVAASLVALDGWAAEVHLAGPGVELDQPMSADLIGDEVVGTGFRSIEPLAPSDVRTDWVVYTSGTTGEPKPVRHTLDTLSRTVSTSAAADLRWGLLYDPNRMAGLQVLLQALITGAAVVAPPNEAALGERLVMLTDHGVTALSATPTLWRLILQLPRTALDLRQITLGGEIADQRILDALATRFPAARIVHVFASTETGAAFSVRDRREGFPVSYMTEPPRGIELQIRGGVLHVHSPGVSSSGPDGFASTGDVVEVVGDRVLFRGRASGVVNVGGANVWPEQVEQLIRSHPDVHDAIVRPKPSALSGNVLIATVVPSATADRSGLAKRVRSWVRQSAPSTHVPAMVKIVEELGVSTTGKVAR